LTIILELFYKNIRPLDQTAAFGFPPKMAASHRGGRAGRVEIEANQLDKKVFTCLASPLPNQRLSV
jgi:hypothetical protein